MKIFINEDDGSMIPLHELLNSKKWEDEEFIKSFNYWMDKLYKNDKEYQAIRIAFDMYSVGLMPINIRESTHDKRFAKPYENALNKIAELFAEIDSLSPEPGHEDEENTKKRNEVLKYIENSIDFLKTTRPTWKKMHKVQAEEHLITNGIKPYRHKDIFIAFNNFISKEA